MKKLIALLLVLVTVFSLTACGSQETHEVSTSAPTENAQEQTTATEAAETTEATEAPTEAAVTTIAETVIHDADGVKVTATGMEKTEYGDLNVKFLVENSTDKNIAFSGDYFVVNNITVYGWLYIEVAAGKKANGSLELYSDTLETASITDIATLYCPEASVYDTDSYDDLAEFSFSLESSANGTYVQTVNEEGDVIFQQDGITVISQSYIESEYEHFLRLLVKNETGSDINIEAENVSVNGFTLDAWMYDTVYAGSVCYCELDIYEDSLTENGIETVEDICFTLEVMDPYTYDTIATSEEIQVFIGQ